MATKVCRLTPLRRLTQNRPWKFSLVRSCFEMVAEVCYMDFSRQFHLWKWERSRSYVTGEKGENGRKGHVNNKSNYFKTASNTEILLFFYAFAIKFVRLWQN